MCGQKFVDIESPFIFHNAKLDDHRQRFKQPSDQNELITDSKLRIQKGKFKSSVWTRTATTLLIALSVIAAALRLFKINYPAQVVFDEVHFGGFANRYLQREYYFDVHPPLGKLLIAGAAWLGGFRGGFDFEKIGMDYTGVPFSWMRSVMAMLGVASVSLGFATLVEMKMIPGTLQWRVSCWHLTLL